MLLLLGFAFLAGIVTVLSPCILPVLPIILSGTVGGDKKKPLGIVTGFILSFTFFTLFLSTIVKLTGLSADFLRGFSIVVIFLFGSSLLIPRVQLLLEQLFTKIANAGPKQNQQSQGFGGGVVIGISLGLLWTPCVGPILASVISLALTGSVTTTAFFITLAYSLGTAIPMLLITYGGRALLNKVPWLLQNTGNIQKGFGILMICTAIAIYFNFDRQFQTYILQTFPNYGTGLTKLEDNQLVQDQLNTLQKPGIDTKPMQGKPMFETLEDYGKAPEIIASGDWYNTDPFTLADLQQQGKVVLVDFWTYSCINCIRTLPYLKSWHEKYADKGLVIVGVHSPEFEFEKDSQNVAKAITDFGITYPVFQDNDFLTWRAYSNRYWPAKYIIDKNGRIRYYHFGEGEYDKTEEVIQELLKEAGNDVDAKIENPTYTIESGTPELYLGYSRIEYLASPEQIQKDTNSTYSAPSVLRDNYFAYTGTWNIGDERSMPAAGGILILKYQAKQVFLVMNPAGTEQTKVRVILDGKVVTTEGGKDVVNGIVTVDSDRLYELISLPTPGRHELKLEFIDGNIEVFAFTFG